MLQYRNNVKPLYIRSFSIILAAFLSLDIISIYLFPSEEGVDTGGVYGVMNIVVIVLFLMLALKAHLLKLARIPIICIIILLSLLLYLFYTVSYIGEPRTPFEVILALSLASFILPHFCEIDTRLFLKVMMLLAIPTLFKVDQVFFKMIVAEDALSTGYSYAFIKPVFVSLIYMCYYYKDEDITSKVIMGIVFLINMIFATFLVAFGTRAIVVSLLLLLGGIYIAKRNNKNGEVSILPQRVIILLVSICLLLFFLIPILSYLQKLLAGNNISLYFVDRFLDMNDRGNITSGRDEIYLSTIDGIKSRPFFGHGIDQFFNNTGHAYPHNFFLQMFYDCGFIISSLLFVPLFFQFLKKIRFCAFDQVVLIMTLFYTSVPGALFSNDLWANNVLWVFFGFVFSKRIARRTPKEINTTCYDSK